MCKFHSANVKRYTYIPNIEHNNWQFILLKKTATNGKRLQALRDVSYAEVHRGYDKLT